MGDIAELLQGADSGMSPLQKKLKKLGFTLAIASIVISVVVFTIGVTTGNECVFVCVCLRDMTCV